MTNVQIMTRKVLLQVIEAQRYFERVTVSPQITAVETALYNLKESLHNLEAAQ